MKPELSIVIPTFNEEKSLADTLESLKVFGSNVEIIVVDGGSADATLEIAENYNAKILHSPRGRGIQLQIGGNAANADVLWFLHADTIPSRDCVRQMTNVLENVKVVGGNFTIRFDGGETAAKFLTRLYPNLRKLNLIYGDSAIFVRREIYEKVGGFQSFPIFEDLDFVRKLSREGEIITLPASVTTSSRRFADGKFILTFLRWTILQVLFWLGVSPETLVKIYFPTDGRESKIN
jgi:rSAM/selenodomain-associated transferase 2